MTFVVSLLLCWVVFEDLRHFRIRNTVVLALAASFVIDLAVRGRLAVLLPHGLFALFGFVILSALFALRAIGGGDVKLLSAALLWVGPEGCTLFAALLLACTAIYVIGNWVGLLPARRRAGRTMIPYGPSIAAAWVMHIIAVARLGT